MHNDAKTLQSAVLQILAIPRLDCLSFLLLVPALTLHLNNNTMYNTFSVHIYTEQSERSLKHIYCKL